MEEELMDFISRFFQNLKSSVLIKNETITITNVPESFEKFYGKKAPYKFTTNPSLRTEEIEFIEKNSYFLKVLSNYLENLGETTLLKINFDYDGEKEIKTRLNLKNSIINKIKSRKEHSLFFRFTFHTSFQYLNEKEKLINEIYIHEGKFVNGDLKDYKVEEGKKSEIKIPDMKEAYFIAKEELKQKTNKKIIELTKKLDTVLKKEIVRIEDHFKLKEKELSLELKKAENKLKELEKEKDAQKINRQKNVIQNLREKLNPEDLLNEKERSILTEKTKHTLNINNKLFNTTLIYHELFCAEVMIKNENTKRTFRCVYNPLTNCLEDLFCPICSKKMNEIYLCKNEHIACKNCITLCNSCKKEYCKDCVKIKCELCGANLCNDCKIRCAECGKIVCKSHTIQDNLSKRYYCNKCLIRCERCSNSKIKSNFKISKKTGIKICEDCYKKEIKESIIRSID